MLFSATFPREVEELANQSLHKPQRIAVGVSAPATTVTHALYPVPQHLKLDLLTALLKKTDAFSMLVFTRTRHRAEKVARTLARQGFETTSLHSDRSQNQRQRALQGFKDGKYQVMVATDIAARGLDIESVSHVINFDIPDTVDAYIHRIGRTGRAEREGDAFTLVTPEDNGMVRDIERALKKPIERRKLEGFDYAAPAPSKQPQPHSMQGRIHVKAQHSQAQPHSQAESMRRNGRGQGGGQHSQKTYPPHPHRRRER
jgi:ATP-dependent RNA helicase RhlE